MRVITNVIDMNAVKRRLALTKAASIATAALIVATVLGGGAWALYSDSPNREYERKVEEAKQIPEPWSRFAMLSKGVDPNAWAMSWPRESEAQSEWAAATYTALQDAIKVHDPRAVEYVTGEKYGTYKSLQPFRDALGAK